MTGPNAVPEPGELLSASLDGELSGPERAQLEHLLDSDADRRDELAALAAVRDAVRGLPPVEPPAGFFERLLDGGLDDDAPGDRDAAGWPSAGRPGSAPAEGDGAVVPIDQARRRRAGRNRRRWIGAGAAVAAVAAAFVLVAGVVPLSDPVVPPVAAFADRHDAMGPVPPEAAGPGPSPVATVVPTTTAATTPATGATGTTAAPGATAYDAMAEEEIAAMAGGADVPAQISRFRRVKGWAGPRVVHLLYSDGRATLSVYEQPGRVDWSALPAGEKRMADAQPIWIGQRGNDEILVLERDAAIITVVADLPPPDLDGVIAAMPKASDGVIDRMAETIRSISHTFGV